MKRLYLIYCSLCLQLFASAQDIIQVEYFVDADAGVGNNTLVNVIPGPDGTFPFTANFNGLPIGYHFLYIRTKDSNGKWSLTGRRVFEIISSNNSKNIESGEYFIDTDPGFGAATPIIVNTPGNVILQNFSAVVNGLSSGYHKLYTRVRDNDGKWSQTSRRNFELFVTSDSLITLFEYFYEQDPGVGNASKINFSPEGNLIIQSFNLPLTCFDANGTYRIYIRTMDSRGKWSHTTQNSFNLKDGSTVTTLKAGLWSDPATWSNGQLPTPTTPVILNHDVTVDVTASCRWLITLCHNVTVYTGVQLTITGN